jgi:hypothetical protein
MEFSLLGAAGCEGETRGETGSRRADEKESRRKRRGAGSARRGTARWWLKERRSVEPDGRPLSFSGLRKEGAGVNTAVGDNPARGSSPTVTCRSPSSLRPPSQSFHSVIDPRGDQKTSYAGRPGDHSIEQRSIHAQRGLLSAAVRPEKGAAKIPVWAALAPFGGQLGGDKGQPRVSLSASPRSFSVSPIPPFFRLPAALSPNQLRPHPSRLPRHSMASSPAGQREPPPPPLRSSPVHLTSHEINILIHCYLQESNLQHSAFTFAQESKLAQTTPDDLIGAKVQRGELLRWLHKGLCWCEVETHVGEVRCRAP